MAKICIGLDVGSSAVKVVQLKPGKRGLQLVLDFVPNHVAPDHPWVGEHPEYFIRGSADDAKNIGKTTKFMTPAKFSSWRISEDITRPSAPSIMPTRISAGSTAK